MVRDGQIRLSEGKGWNDDGGKSRLFPRCCLLHFRFGADFLVLPLLLLPSVEPTRQVVSFAEDLLSAAAALETQAEASVEEAKETQSLNEHALNLEEKMDNLRIGSKTEE